jgi:hypothetical protein
MALIPRQRKTLHGILLDAYPVEGSLNIVLLNGPGMSLDDLAKPGTRLERYLAAILELDARRKIVDLFSAIYDDQPDNAALHAKLADLFNDVWPEGAPDDPHLHLLPSNKAFVNRDTLRGMIATVVDDGAPRVIVLRGRGLAGTSHCGELLLHVALKKGGIDVILLNLDLIGDRSPYEVAKALGLNSTIGLPPSRTDLLGAGGDPDVDSPQLRSHLCQWFLGQARAVVKASGNMLWLVIDNCHRDTVPASTREMVATLIQLVDAGTVPGLHLFVMGAEQTIPVALPLTVEQLDIPPLGRPDIVAYLTLVKDRHGSLDEFATVEAATDAVLAGCDLDHPQVEALWAMNKGLTALVQRVR